MLGENYPSGVMQGNIYWAWFSSTNVDIILRGLNNSIVEQPFRTRTCVIGNGYSDTIRRGLWNLCTTKLLS